jgi:mono/diheme cytochrome c family protein
MRFKTNLIAILALITTFSAASNVNASCRSKTIATTTTEISVAVPFAVPIGVPVATFAPYFYSTQQFQSPVAVIQSQPATTTADLSPVHPLTSNRARPTGVGRAQGGSSIESPAHPTASQDPQRAANSSLLATHCATCHAGTSPKANFSLEHLENLSSIDRLNAIRAVVSGKMPKGGQLTSDEIRAVVSELSSASTNESRPTNEPVPPPPSTE